VNPVALASKAARNTPPRLWKAPLWSYLTQAPIHDFPIRDMILYSFSGIEDARRILEIGPGSGITAYTVSGNGRLVTAVEVSKEAVDALKESVGDCENLQILFADLSKPGLSSQVGRDRELAYALDVFEYVPTPESFLRNIYESLADGGEAFITFPNVPPPVGDGVTYFASTVEIEALFRRAGFEQLEISCVELTGFARNAYWLLHELPLKTYRTFRAKRDELPQTYEQTWAFKERKRLARLRPFVHSYWRIVSFVLRLGGTPWRKCKSQDGKILGRQVIIRAWK
jgi:SAM-dependent methyltransferase